MRHHQYKQWVGPWPSLSGHRSQAFSTRPTVVHCVYEPMCFAHLFWVKYQRQIPQCVFHGSPILFHCRFSQKLYTRTIHFYTQKARVLTGYTFIAQSYSLTHPKTGIPTILVSQASLKWTRNPITNAVSWVYSCPPLPIRYYSRQHQIPVKKPLKCQKR